ncbi:MAG: hypothetical protein IJB47_04960 [Oscillospiraceae bacterium]|nr:hypothetical protein [Oscillospiraceae bacterium]
MQKKSQDFSMEDIQKLANSPAGQQLLAMLRQNDPAKLQQVVNQATGGNYAQAGDTLRSMLSSPEAKKLLKDLEG